MASYQIRQRDPLLDSNTQAALERRGKELLGVGLIVAGLLCSLMLMSYVPEDPGWLAATDQPAQNFLGRIGASIASPLFVIVGMGSWGLAAVLLTWGARFALHKGEDRAINRLIFAPIGIALASVYASTHVPGIEWTHSFGLGGLFGDTFLGAVLGVAPVNATFGLKVMSLFVGAGMLGMAAFVLGFTARELQSIARFLLIGLVTSYAMMMTLLGKGAGAAAVAARTLQERNAIRRDQKAQDRAEAAAYAAAEEAVRPRDARAMVQRAEQDWGAPAPLRATKAPLRAEPNYEHPVQQAPEKTSLLSRIPSLMKRTQEPEPEMIEPFAYEYGDAPAGEDRIKAKISSVIKNRVRQMPAAHTMRPAPELKLGRQEPPVARAQRPHPLVLNPVAPRVPMAPFAEPPMMPSPPEFSQDYADDLVSLDYDDDADLSAYLPDPELVETPMVYEHPVTEPKKVVQHIQRKAPPPSRQARAEAQPILRFDESGSDYELPPLSLLSSPVEIQRHHLSDEALEENARMLENVLDDYGVKGEIVSVRPGPVVTMYELEPAPGLKASRVIGLADDIARSMSALSARVSTVPGRSVIGIELPNVHREKVVLREILSARDFGDSNMRLPLALGKDIGGDPIIANLAKMPHLLIAGTTGSGKSVAINTMILSLLYKLTPDECRMIMIDPKMLELSVYDGIPHLLSPVVTDPKKAVVALKWTVGEMEDRYRKMSKMGVRNIEGYNGRVRDAIAKGELFSRTVQTGFDEDTGEPIFETEQFAPETIPYIVVIVDEMADLMMVAGKEIEACIQRLAQMARASGIHLIMATQRPSVDVITGTIKANFPTRISFQVTSKIDSRTILGEQGAEQLLGMGDMLYMAGGAKITRVHGPFVSDEEVEEIVNHLKGFGPPSYIGGVVEGPDEDSESSIDLVLGLGSSGNDLEDALYDTAVAIVIKDRKCSTSYIQRKLAIGYNKAARLVEQMEEAGLVSPANHVGKREILVPEQ
ncbi:DNA translocase FtsK [Pseudogemmobacter sp. W21_MBD1_M6]|uniref:DNA translocase FtsK n=1 Tax=Pseudogemmobacter sp. W21_MBD1_M6 TaxID=3240271 RepID=UPI003F96EBD7